MSNITNIDASAVDEFDLDELEFCEELDDQEFAALYGDFDDGQGDFSSPIGSGRPGEEDEMFESFQLDESGDVDTEPWYLDEEQEEVSFNEIVDEVGYRERLRALRYFKSLQEGPAVQKINAAIVKLQEQCKSRFARSRPRRWISHVLTERERRFHSLRQAPGQLREGYKQAEGRLQRAGGRIKEKYAKQYEKLDQSVRPVVRKMITGDRNKTVRVFFQQPAVIRFTDRLCFLVAIGGMMTSQALLLTNPHLMPLWYVLWTLVLLTYRYVDYKSQKYHLFLLDFCYFVQVLLIVNICFFYNSQTLTNVVFAYANGPLAFAIITWRNSLVFHDIDKITSTFIHIFPPLVSFAMRWHPVCWTAVSEAPYECKDGPNVYDFSFVWDGLVVPSFFYLIWQVLYLLICEWWLGKYIADDPEIQTSLKWLSTDTRSGVYKIATGCCMKLGVMVPGETLNPAAWKTKIIFVVSQLVYTIALLLPGKLLHSSYFLHTIWLMYIFATCVWNGAGYYIEVFSRRYSKVAFADKIDKTDGNNDSGTPNEKVSDSDTELNKTAAKKD